MEHIQYFLIVVGGVAWTALVCWLVWYISILDKPEDDK